MVRVMIPRAVAVALISCVITAAYSGPGWSLEGQRRSVQGLWRLMAVMPAGVPSEEVPDGFGGYICYWFHDDGTVTLIKDGRSSTTRNKGFWRQKGRKLIIFWKTGTRLILRVVRKRDDSLILTGFGLQPLWYRFTRVF